MGGEKRRKEGRKGRRKARDLGRDRGYGVANFVGEIEGLKGTRIARTFSVAICGRWP